MLETFDHVTIAVGELASAARSYEALLGAPPVWRGEHPELGTEAALFALGNSAIELLAPRRVDGVLDERAQGLATWIAERGEGVSAIAFGTRDAEGCSAALRARGVRATRPQEGEAHGTLLASGAQGTRRYRTVELSPKASRGVSVLAVEREDLRALFAAQAPAVDACDALDHVVLRTADPDAAIALYRDGLGIRLALDRMLGETRMLFFRVGQVTLEVVQDLAAGEHDAFYGLAYRVRDLDAAHARLRRAGFDVSTPREGNKPGTRVLTVRSGTCGVPTLILRDPSRDPRT